MNQTTLAAALLDPGLPCPPGFTTWNGSDPTRRLAVHRNNIVVSLIDALSATFPVTRQFVGDDFFHAMARTFVHRQPPTSPIMAFYGEALPDFIASFVPAQALPCLPDLARLEMARLHACHAADAALVSREDIGAALATDTPICELVIACHPSVQVLRSVHAVVSLWAAHQDDALLEQLGELDMTRPESAVVLRQAGDAVVLPVPLGVAVFTQSLLHHRPLAHASAEAQASDQHFDLAAALQLLLTQGAVSSISPP